MRAKTANTVLSDINEIMTGYFLAGHDWSILGKEAQKHANRRMKQALPAEVADAMGKAEAMARAFLAWGKKNGYSGRIVGVWWTARPGSMATVGHEVDQRKNPTDILVRFSGGPANGFLGLSAKSTHGQSDIGFKNPGVGTIDRNLKLNLAEISAEKTAETIKKFKLPESASARTTYIRANAGIKTQTEKIGSELLAHLRDTLMAKLKTLSQEELQKYLLSDWMDAEVMIPPYIKVTGKGNKEPYTATVMDPVNNEKLSALSRYKISLSSAGNETISIAAGEKKIMKIRFKFQAEKMASSITLSGDPW